MAGTKLPFYLHKFTHLRTDRTGDWTAATQGQAPHKPILLLSVLDLFAKGPITSNLIEIMPELGELFATYWLKVMPPERRGNARLHPRDHLAQRQAVSPRTILHGMICTLAQRTMRFRNEGNYF